MVPVQAVCNTILLKSFEENISVTPMKLQKLVYFIFKDYLESTGKELFSEQFEAWQYGPVLSSVYSEFKSFGKERITKFAKNADGSATIVSPEGAPEVMKSITRVWEKYKFMTGVQLSQITHSPDSAWSKSYHSSNLFLNLEDIKNEHIG